MYVPAVCILHPFIVWADGLYEFIVSCPPFDFGPSLASWPLDRDADSAAMSSVEEYDSISRLDVRVVRIPVVYVRVLDEVGFESIKDGFARGGLIEEKFYVRVGDAKPLSEEPLHGQSVIDAAI